MKILRKEVEDCLKDCGGMTDIIDDVIKASFNITDKEYDIICNTSTEEDMEMFIDALDGMETPSTFSQKKKGLIVRNKYVDYFKSL